MIKELCEVYDRMQILADQNLELQKNIGFLLIELAKLKTEVRLIKEESLGEEVYK